MYKSLVLAACLIIFTGCSSNGINRTDINQLVEVIYAEVIHTKLVPLDSKADEAAATGAIEGAIENSDGDSGDVVAGALASAVASALFVSIEEGSREGLLVSLRGIDQTSYNIVVKRKDIQEGDCLQLIRGDEVSILHVESKFCRPSVRHSAN